MRATRDIQIEVQVSPSGAFRCPFCWFGYSAESEWDGDVAAEAYYHVYEQHPERINDPDPKNDEWYERWPERHNRPRSFLYG
jgi:hypothetical protein